MSELDSMYYDLKSDLKDNMANQEVIEAIIENYRLKITILEDILTEITPLNDECISKTNGNAL
jgi:3-hydroxyacyl-CoA dehydrogenase